MTHVAALLCLVLLPWLVSRAAAGSSSVLCIRSAPSPNGDAHLTFLQRAPPSPRLYHGAWSRERALLHCAWSDDAAVIRDYSTACRERAHEFSKHSDEAVESVLLAAEEELCVPVGGARTAAERPAGSGGHKGRAGRSEVKTRPRVKRALMIPGTLWCGSGNDAPSYADLGVFADTDSCCREHDHCQHSIPSFRSQFGVFNRNIFAMSHCDCDHKFHGCLKAAGDRISALVGYTFFNLLKVPCFDLSRRLLCSRRNWFGMCKERKMGLYAEVHPPAQYDSPNATEAGANATEAGANATAPTGTLWTPALAPPSWSAAVGNASAAPSAGLAGRWAQREEEGNTLPAGDQSAPDVAARRLSECGVYRELDGCEDKILPQQTRHGVHNPEAATRYHCSCTRSALYRPASRRQAGRTGGTEPSGSTGCVSGCSARTGAERGVRGHVGRL
ncbi:Group 3 secretory phospholipase A2 [Liparis tanakae]|uniref:phospholipase A2 n=1 Tax=Liparis tanakae TaxID=230148 RepID=A0A4Z2G4K1_9TELE|nr:Group 3 secretory phospholipase A2 [Liparis tanakae]